MKWIEVSVTTAPAAAEAVLDILLESLSGGVSEEAVSGGFLRLRGYLPAGPATPVTLEAIQKRIHALPAYGLDTGPLTVLTSEIEDEDWAAAWQSDYTAFAVGRIWITPTWGKTPPPSGAVIIVLDPGMAFGSGLHPSTQMCLTVLQERITGGERVFDVGVGSGILSIAAAKLGASTVLAIDNDPVAVAVARENIARNRVSDRVEARAGDLLAGVGGQAGIILANLTADLHAEFLPSAAEHLLAGGALVASGIVDGRVLEVETVARAAGLRVAERVRSGEWVCLVLTIGNR